MDRKVLTFAERALSIRAIAKADMDTLRQQMVEADLDPSAVLRLASWLERDEAKRAEQDAIDEQYRFLAGVLPEPAELPEESDIAKAAALYADKMTVRAVAKEMGVSVGRAHKLKVLAAAFTVHAPMNVNKPPAHWAQKFTPEQVAAAQAVIDSIDADTGEIIENATTSDTVAGDDTRTAVPSSPAEVVANSSSGGVDGHASQNPPRPVVAVQSGACEANSVTRSDAPHVAPAGIKPGPLDTNSDDGLDIPDFLRRERAA